MIRRLLACLVCALPLFVAGCASYTLGSSLKGYQSIFVETFHNATEEANLEFTSTQAALAAFQRDGTLKISTGDQADLTLETTLRETRFEAVGYAANRTATAQEFRFVVTAHITLTNRRTGVPLFENRRVRGEYVFESVGDTQQARLSAQPYAARDLARQIVKQVVEFW